jgi:hypothetical protein
MFGYGNELGWFYKSPNLENIIVDGSMCHIKHHTINYKCDNLNYRVLHKTTSLIKNCENPMDLQN